MNVQKLYEYVREFFCDTSRLAEDTKADLEWIKEEIDILLDTL